MDIVPHVAHITKLHGANQFLTKKHVPYISEMACLYVMLCELTESGFVECLSTQNVWYLEGQNLHFSVDVAFFRKHAEILAGNDYKILQGNAECQSDAEVPVDGPGKLARFLELISNQLQNGIQS